jgi:hypothetical protein
MAENSSNPQGISAPMSPIALALFLFMTGQPAVESPAPPPEAAPAAEAPPAEDRFPVGAPHEDYQFVAWCYGSLRGYLDLHDQVMPEVTRIETTFRPPGRKLADDLKVYADMQKDGRVQLKTFQSAMTAAEKASLRPINTVGAEAVQKGRSIWRSSGDVKPARLAQEWMSWALPARCETTAKTLHDRAVLMGASFKVNEEPDPPAETPAAEVAPPAPAETPPAETPRAPSPN